MTEREAFLAIRNAIRLENIGRKVSAKITPSLREAFKVLQLQISDWPEGKLEREIVYKQLFQRMPALFGNINDAFYRELTTTLRDEADEQMAWAARMLGEGGSISQGAAGSSATLGASPASDVAIGFGQQAIPPAQLAALTDETKVLGQTLERLFRPQAEGSIWIKSQIDLIDRVVKQGFINGETNEQIARNMVAAANRSLAGSKAVARTAVMDMSQRAHERMWDANADRIALWEFDATFDYRVCPQCYPYDGKRAKDRTDLPTVPVHPNCRCRVIPVTKTQLALEKEEIQDGMEMSIVEVNKPGTKPLGRVYKTKAKVGGKKLVKSAREIQAPKGRRPEMADFIANANPATREAVLGKVRAREFEYLTADNSGPKRDIRDALRAVTNGDAASFEKAQRARRKRRK